VGFRLAFPPLEESIKTITSRTAKTARSFDALEGEWVIFYRNVSHALELPKLLFRPRPPAKLLEPHPESVSQVGEVNGVGIGPLIFFVERNPEFFLEQGGKPGLWLSEQLRHDLRVLKAGNPNSVVSIEDPNVVVRAVHQQWNRGIAHDLPQRPKIVRFYGQRIDDHVVSVGADLDQAHLVKVGMHRVGLGVEGYSARSSTSFRGLAHTIGCVDPEGSDLGHGRGW
jgi:hypothetical protein